MRVLTLAARSPFPRDPTSTGRADSITRSVMETAGQLPPTGCVATIVPAECALTNAAGTLLVVSVNGADACVTFQGSATDPEGQPLQFAWLTNGSLTWFGAVFTNCFELGCHTLTFVAT